MMKRLRLFQSVWMQIPVLVFATAASLQIFVVMDMTLFHSSRFDKNKIFVVMPLIDLAAAMDTIDVSQQQSLLKNFNAHHPDMNVEISSPTMMRYHEVTPAVGSLQAVYQADNGRIVLMLARGKALVSDFPPPRLPPLSHFGLQMLAGMSIGVLCLSLWVVRSVTAPMRRFADAANNLSMDKSNKLLPEAGPYEVQVASAAFNHMQTRLQDMIGDRTRMLAAIGHDLRTPITRLRLRADKLPQSALQQSIIADLDHMNNLVFMALTFIRDGQAEVQWKRFDLASLLQTTCDDFTDLGHSVHFTGASYVPVKADFDGFKRIFTNLIDNAVVYGRNVQVELEKPDSDQGLRICVQDDGAVSDIDRKAIAADGSRISRNASGRKEGFGLGLTIVQATAEAHGGCLDLEYVPGGGLRCMLHFPPKLYDYQQGR